MPIDPVLAPLKPTERELRDYCLVVASQPGSITCEDPLMVYFLAREFLRSDPRRGGRQRSLTSSTNYATTAWISPERGTKLRTFWAGSAARSRARIKSSVATKGGEVVGRARIQKPRTKTPNSSGYFSLLPRLIL